MVYYKCKLMIDNSQEELSGNADLDEILQLIDSRISQANKECDCCGR
ncbi:MAG: hypothetical protein QW400_01330 [Candidatus Diapherotrites archaeon]